MLRVEFRHHEHVLGPEELPRLLGALPDEEQARLRHYRHPGAVSDSLRAHLLLRAILVEELRVGDVVVGRKENGCPHVVRPSDPALHVSLSHAKGWVAAGAMLGGRIGVDIEVERPVHETLFERTCHPDELVWLMRLAPPRRCARFFQLWTLKESVMKATELGLALAPETLCFDFDGERPHLRDGDEWELSSRSPAPGVWLAVCSEVLAATAATGRS